MDINESLKFLPLPLREKIIKVSSIQSIPQGTEILKPGQYISVIPVVLEGLIKVFTYYQDKELLLYYILPDESCVMSYSASLHNEPCRIAAVAEEDTKAILIPAEHLTEISSEFPSFNKLFFDQYNQRYSDLLDTIHHLLFEKLDQRVLDYLKKKSELTGQNPLKLSHRQIATELGTSREVISRVIKKLESEMQVQQVGQQIKII